MRRIWVFGVLFLTLCVLLPKPVQAATQGPTDAEWAHILASNGFGDKDKLLTALEVMFAGSGGDCSRTNATSGARGCFQFMLNTLADDNCARNPVCSTQAAYRISKGGNDWGKWEAFTSKNYLGQEKRARAAIAGATPGCDWVTDAACFLNMVGQPVPIQFSQPNLPSLDQASPVDLIKLFPPKVFAEIMGTATAFLLREVDSALLGIFDALWFDMTAGEDNLNGQMRWGGNLLVLDNTPLKGVWAVQLGIAIGPLMLLLITVLIALRLFQALLTDADSSHEYKRDPLRVFIAVILAASSFFLVTELVSLGNALTNTIMSNTHAELRMLPSYQGLNVLKPDFGVSAGNYGTALVETVASLLIVVEILVIFALYVLRLLILGSLAVLAPYAIAAGVLPEGRKLTSFWAGLLFAMVAIKPLNALLFSMFLLWGVSSSSGILNSVFLAAMLFFMALVPSTLIGAFGSPGAAWAAGHGAVRGFVSYQPLRLAGGQAAKWVKQKVA